MRLRPARVLVVGLGHVRDEVCGKFGHLEERERVPQRRAVLVVGVGGRLCGNQISGAPPIDATLSL